MTGRSEESKLRVAIVGAGCSGTLVAAELIRQARRPVEVHLIDRAATGRGVAYGTTDSDHLLNVPAARMSGRADDPDHFVRWLDGRGMVRPGDGPYFAPRLLYGEYLEDLLEEAAAAATPGVRLHRLHTEVTDTTGEGRGVRLALDDGDAGTIYADAVVLALGNRPGPGPLGSSMAPPHYYRDPWAPDALRDIDLDQPVLIVGTGLTMIDLALSLRRLGHRAGIDAVSPRGLLPDVHPRPASLAAGAGPPTFSLMREPAGIRRWFRLVRVAARDRDWRAVIDDLRPESVALWQRLSDDERRRFLRHARPWWEAGRHRMAPEIGEKLREMRAGRFLRVHAARLRAAHPEAGGARVELSARGDGARRHLLVGRILNATGPESDVRRMTRAPVPQLLAAGLARSHPLGIGFDVTPDGRLIDGAGRPSELLVTLGPPLKGAQWESTAVPEIRSQARDLAARLLAGG